MNVSEALYIAALLAHGPTADEPTHPDDPTDALGDTRSWGHSSPLTVRDALKGAHTMSHTNAALSIANLLAHGPTAEEPPVPAPLNGAELLAAKKTRDGYIVLVAWHNEYVTAWASALFAPGWSNGHYFRYLPEAQADFDNRS